MKWNRRSLLLVLFLLCPAGAHSEPAGILETCRDEESEARERVLACSRLLDNNALVTVHGESYRNRGSAYADREQYDLAIADETKAIALDAHDAAAYNLRAWSYLKSGNSKQASVDVNQALSLNPQFPDALDTKARVYEAMGMRKEAIEEYRKALAINPRHEDSIDGLARLGLE